MKAKCITMLWWQIPTRCGQISGEGGPMEFSIFHCKPSIRYPGSGALICI